MDGFLNSELESSKKHKVFDDNNFQYLFIVI